MTTGSNPPEGGEGSGLVSEAGDLNYGDVSLLLRGWLDLCAEFAWRHYDGKSTSYSTR